MGRHRVDKKKRCSGNLYQKLGFKYVSAKKDSTKMKAAPLPVLRKARHLLGMNLSALGLK